MILNSIEREFKVVKRLYSLIPPGKKDFSPQEGMRTMEELLRYLTWASVSSIDYYSMEDNSKAGSNFKKYYEEAEKVTFDSFPEAVEVQIEKLREVLNKFSDEDIETKTVILPWKEEMNLGQAIISTSFAWLAAYKMQLFLYLKLSGQPELDTMDCWVRTNQYK